jgi:hypothetical protein
MDFHGICFQIACIKKATITTTANALIVSYKLCTVGVGQYLNG